MDKEKQEKLKKASAHLFYEIDMLNISAVKANNAGRKKAFALSKKNNDKIWKVQIELNLSLDSFTIHTRNLIEFFGKNKNKETMNYRDYLKSSQIAKIDKIIAKHSNLLFLFSKSRGFSLASA